MTENGSRLVPLAQAAIDRKLNREQLLRRIQQGTVPGVQRYGRWFVVEDAGTKSATHDAPQSAA